MSSDRGEYVMRRAELLDQMSAAHRRIETLTEQLQDLRREEAAANGNPER